MSGDYLVYLAASLGLTVVVVVQAGGPGAWARERTLRPCVSRAWEAIVLGLGKLRVRPERWRALRRLARRRGELVAVELLGCGTCFSAWSGAAVGLVVLAMTGAWLPLMTLWLVAPFAFWMAARMGR